MDFNMVSDFIESGKYHFNGDDPKPEVGQHFFSSPPKFGYSLSREQIAENIAKMEAWEKRNFERQRTYDALFKRDVLSAIRDYAMDWWGVRLSEKQAETIYCWSKGEETLHDVLIKAFGGMTLAVELLGLKKKYNERRR